MPRKKGATALNTFCEPSGSPELGSWPATSSVESNAEWEIHEQQNIYHGKTRNSTEEEPGEPDFQDIIFFVS